MTRENIYEALLDKATGNITLEEFDNFCYTHKLSDIDNVQYQEIENRF